ncbi:CASP-like protein 4D1 [Coffea eugenioides]|uniref:CASP-like protein 4D1 n=1 Tax=Coffea eugenioides TaxID=49369 RepID=UPI000F60C3E5|nr:CASP-like protein 4D1 [Coffea eugenioides]
MSQVRYDGYSEPRSSKVPIFSLAARVATFASLVVTVVILQTNKVTLNTGFRLTYSSLFHSYRYMFYVSILGLVYTVMQIPLAVYYLRARKRLIERYSLLYIDFYGDKIMSLLLGAGVGAAFGATRDLNKAYEESNVPKIHDFFDLSYVAAVFILIGCLGSAISSIFSSLALSKGE